MKRRKATPASASLSSGPSRRSSPVSRGGRGARRGGPGARAEVVRRDHGERPRLGQLLVQRQPPRIGNEPVPGFRLRRQHVQARRLRPRDPEGGVEAGRGRLPGGCRGRRVDSPDHGGERALPRPGDRKSPGLRPAAGLRELDRPGGIGPEARRRQVLHDRRLRVHRPLRRLQRQRDPFVSLRLRRAGHPHGPEGELRVLRRRLRQLHDRQRLGRREGQQHRQDARGGPDSGPRPEGHVHRQLHVRPGAGREQRRQPGPPRPRRDAETDRPRSRSASTSTGERSRASRRGAGPRPGGAWPAT